MVDRYLEGHCVDYPQIIFISVYYDSMYYVITPCSSFAKFTQGAHELLVLWAHFVLERTNTARFKE